MPNIASVLKDEVLRVSRKALRAETEGLKKASAHYRSEIAALKRRIADLEKQMARLGKNGAKDNTPPPTQEDAGHMRFSAKGLRTMRQRLGLSAADLGALVGVSGQTIYNWEAESTRPRPNQLPAIVALRGLGKREVTARLKELAEPAK